MKKSYKWTAELDGTCYEIECWNEGNSYILWAGDEHVATIYRRSFGEVDEEISLLGHPARLVVWNERPEIFVEGFPLAGGKCYSEQRAWHDRAERRGALVVLIIGVAFCAVAAVLWRRGWDSCLFVAVAAVTISVLKLLKYKK